MTQIQELTELLTCTPHPPSGGLLLVKSAQEIFNLTPKACILTAERVNVSMHIALSH